MSQRNTKWAKLYTQTDSQMLVTITPSDNGWLVEKQMMVSGELNSVVCYDGGDEDYAREVFDSIDRDAVAVTMDEVINGVDEDTEEENPQMDAGPEEEKMADAGPDTEKEEEEEVQEEESDEEGMSEEEIQGAYDALSKEELKGWTSCMKKKIVGHYGPEVEACVDGITHGNWEKVLECIVTVLGITDPEVWIPEQIVLFTGWSLECIFGVDSDKD